MFRLIKKLLIFQNLEIFVCVAFFIAAAISGPLRWGLAMVGLAPLAYLPVLAGAGVVIISIFKQLIYGEFGARALLLLLILFFGLVVGVLLTPNIKQTLFAFYMFIPLYMGVVLAPAWKSIMQYKLPLLIVWIIITLGVILNPYLIYPWVGFEYSVGGVSVETSREWWSGEVQRYAGLARASFDAAVQIVILCTLLASLTPNRFYRFILYGLTAYAVRLTDAKTMLVVLAIVFFCLEIPRLFLLKLRFLIVAGLVLLGFAMPLTGWLFEPRLNAVNTSQGLASYEDRLRFMWPEAFDLWLDRGTLITGRGLGGIGTAQTYFEPARFNAGDNLFLYLMVTLGLFALPLIIYSCAKLSIFNVYKSDEHRNIFVLGLIPLSYGLTANVIENASLAILVGCVARLVSDKTLWITR